MVVATASTRLHDPAYGPRSRELTIGGALRLATRAPEDYGRSIPCRFFSKGSVPSSLADAACAT